MFPLHSGARRHSDARFHSEAQLTAFVPSHTDKMVADPSRLWHRTPVFQGLDLTPLC